jgi:Rad52/22 family double-strand break repair protein
VASLAPYPGIEDTMTTQELHIGDTVRTYSGEIGTVLSGPWMDNENGEQLCTVKVGDRCFPHGVAELEIVKASSPTILESVQQVNEMLLRGEPHNISEDDATHYTGYKTQWIVDAMNAVFGFDGWGFSEVCSDIHYLTEKPIALSQVKVWLKGVEFQPIAHGQGKCTRGDLGDALKSAQTDALKKALSYFSIGNRAYKGQLKGGTNNHN